MIITIISNVDITRTMMLMSQIIRTRMLIVKIRNLSLSRGTEEAEVTEETTGAATEVIEVITEVAHEATEEISEATGAIEVTTVVIEAIEETAAIEVVCALTQHLNVPETK